MKFFFAAFFILSIIVSACASSTSTIPSKSAPTSTETKTLPTATATEILPMSTFTLMPTATLSLPVGQLTPVPSSNTKITSQNLKDLQEIARYYGEINYFVKLTKDEKFLFILDPDGITKYNYESMELITHIALANSASDFQISNDGTWMIIDNNWLLDLRNENEPQIYALPDLLNFHPQIFALSPDGSMIAAQRYSCPNLCDHELRIVSTKDFSVTHTSRGPTLQNVFTFSPDGTYFAVSDTIMQENPNGSTGPAGSVVSIWTTSDFTKVSSFTVRFPFRVSSIAISEDNTTLAMSQLEFIDIYDIGSGNSTTTIAALCTSYQRKMIFAPSSPLRLLEKSDCSSRTWIIMGNTAISSTENAPDFSKIVFDEKGDFKTIPYPYPATSNLRAYRQEYYFRFLNNDTVSFKSFDEETSDRHSCDLPLATSSFDCQSHAPKEENGQVIGKDRILASDGKYYVYTVSPSTVDIFSFENPSQKYYSIPFGKYGFDLLALDPINHIIFYNMALSPSIVRPVILDMTNDRILQKWEGATFISSLVFSENGKYAAFCRNIGYNNRPNKDNLIIFDLTEKKIIYNETFTCSGVSLAITQDGTKLAIEHYYLKNPTDARYSLRFVIFNTLPPYDKKYVEIESSSRAAIFSPDNSLLAIACGESDICFFDVATNNKIYQLKAHSHITNLAFSPDGNFLAASSDWGLISLWAVPPFISASNP